MAQRGISMVIVLRGNIVTFQEKLLRTQYDVCSLSCFYGFDEFGEQAKRGAI